jgi:hypothetical protein
MTDDKRVIDTTKPSIEIDHTPPKITLTHPESGSVEVTPDGITMTNVAGEKTVFPTVTSGGTGEFEPVSLAEPATYKWEDTTSMDGGSPMAPPSPEFIATIQNGETELKYTYKLEKQDTRVCADAEAFAGLAAHEIWAVTIEEDGKWYAAISAYVWRLNEQNTVPANRYLQARASDSIAVFDHDVKVADFTLPKKAQVLLDKLNS